MNTFDAIRHAALRIVETEGCPENAKDFLVRLVADDDTFVHYAQALAMLSLTCPAFSEFMKQTTMATAVSFVANLADHIEGHDRG